MHHRYREYNGKHQGQLQSNERARLFLSLKLGLPLDLIFVQDSLQNLDRMMKKSWSLERQRTAILYHAFSEPRENEELKDLEEVRTRQHDPGPPKQLKFSCPTGGFRLPFRQKVA